MILCHIIREIQKKLFIHFKPAVIEGKRKKDVVKKIVILTF